MRHKIDNRRDAVIRMSNFDKIKAKVCEKKIIVSLIRIFDSYELNNTTYKYYLVFTYCIKACQIVINCQSRSHIDHLHILLFCISVYLVTCIHVRLLIINIYYSNAADLR